jgi:hypothetical protein
MGWYTKRAEARFSWQPPIFNRWRWWRMGQIENCWAINQGAACHVLRIAYCVLRIESALRNTQYDLPKVQNKKDDADSPSASSFHDN